MKSKNFSKKTKKSPRLLKPELNPSLQAAESLQYLRHLAREAHQNALARLEAEIVHVLRCVTPESEVNSDGKPRRDLKRIVRQVEEFDINPNKGRCKDLRRLDKLVGHLTEIVDQW